MTGGSPPGLLLLVAEVVAWAMAEDAGVGPATMITGTGPDGGGGGSRHCCTVEEEATALANADAPQLPPWDCAIDWASADSNQEDTAVSAQQHQSSTGRS